MATVETRVRYDPIVDEFYILLKGEKPTPYLVEVDDYVHIMFDKDNTDIVGVVIINYDAFLEDFFKNMQVRDDFLCSDCPAKSACFAANIKMVLRDTQVHFTDVSYPRRYLATTARKLHRIAKDRAICEV